MMGERYRRQMLAHGGSKEPMLMVQGNSNLEIKSVVTVNITRKYSQTLILYIQECYRRPLPLKTLLMH